MGALSNQLLVVTILLYVFAMLCYAIEYAFGNRSVIAKVAVTVGAGPVPADEPAPVSPLPARAGAIGVLLTVLGLACHALTLITRGIAAGRVPWGNMYEFVIAVSLVGTVAWLVVLTRFPQLRHLGLFVSLAASILLAVAGMSLYTPAGPLVPALHSYWLVIHVTAAMIAAGILTIGFAQTICYLVQDRMERAGGGPAFMSHFPSAESIDKAAYRMHAFAFPIWTFAVIAGAIWAENAWGRYWGWDPKETWAFITWLVYACYLHARATAGWRGRKAAYLAMLGYSTFLFNYLVVNIFLVGLHSYAGVG